MTTSTWDHSQLRAEFSQCSTFGEVLLQLEKNFSQRGQVVCEVRVNGAPLNDEEELLLSKSPLGEIQDLMVLTNEPANLIGRALDSALQFIPGLSKICLESADEFRGSDLVRTRQAFTEVLDGCSWLIETLKHVRGACSGIGKPILSVDRWYEAEKTINLVVRNLGVSYSSQDFVVVADLLEYEMTTALDIWTEALLIERARW
jgi:hypothetical protein